MRKVLIAVGVVVLAVGGGAYWYLSQALEHTELPPEVETAETALALPATFALVHIDVAGLVNAERTLLGEEDRQALVDPMTEGNAFFSSLSRQGLNPREALQQVLIATTLGEPDVVNVAVIALGEFQSDRVAAALAESYDVEPTQVAGQDALRVTAVSEDSCEVSQPFVVHLGDHRVIAGTRLGVESTLQRIESKAPPGLDLSEWRSFRTGRHVSLGLLVPPGAAVDALGQPLAQIIGKLIEEEFAPVTAIYVGVRSETLPPGFELDLRIDTESDQWPVETAAKLSDWRGAMREESGISLPSLEALQDLVTIKPEGQSLIFSTTLNRDSFSVMAEVPSDLFRLMFASFGGGSAQTAGTDRAPPEEQVLPQDQVARFEASYRHSDLSAFAPEPGQPDRWMSQVGPFGIRLASVELVQDKDGAEEVVQLDLEVESSRIDNVKTASLHEIKDDSRAQVLVTVVSDADGGNLLREEPCGEERNLKAGELEQTSRSRYVNQEFIDYPAVAGSKTIRLRPGAGLDDIAVVDGFVRLRLPSEVETLRLETPLAGQVLERPELRMVFKESDDPGAVRYYVSGRIDRVLDLRALNADGEYLAPAGSSGSGRLLTSGKSISRNFQGDPKAIEVVLARSEDVQDYPFRLVTPRPLPPNWSARDLQEVTTAERSSFTQAHAATNFDDACERGTAAEGMAPFQICLQDLSVNWGGNIYARFEVIAPQSPAVENSLSTMQLVYESVEISGPEGQPQRSLEVAGSDFVTNLSKAYNQDYLSATWSDWVSNAGDEEIDGADAVSISGKLVVRLPKKLERFTLDLGQLGNEASHPAGYSARFIRVGDGYHRFEMMGPRETFVQFVPRAADGTVLGTSNEQIGDQDGEADYQASVGIAGDPVSLDFVFAAEQDIIEYPFEVKLAP